MKYDNLFKAGATVSIVLGSIGLSYALFLSIYTSLTFNDHSNWSKNDLYFYQFIKVINGLKIFFSIISIIFLIPTIILSSLLLKGKYNNYKLVAIFSIIFAGVIGGVLMLCGKYQKDDKNIIKDKTIISNNSIDDKNI
ncbi:hypothetical protein SLITO_v1c07390 [Spiroplasma litorale]|uniref:Uncharacterized protein n=1 Tax=Spiroplasma litorale TaxID=216942 RepID=A0A0K1W222_9MOLU|nr:hypothetical protein [Spiroplasma litorale]AKX34364.1 hypothetical protein SLITO_v1c07390 [Spiroplasma litorale]